MDSEMPIMDGTTAMSHIRKEHGEDAPYMIIVTASGELHLASSLPVL